MPEPTGAAGPTIAVFGCFDVESLGEQLVLRVARHELARRRPSARVRAFAPFGATRPLPFDGGEPVEPLLPADAALARALGAASSVVVLTAPDAARDPAWLAGRYGVDPSVVAPAVALLLDGPPSAPSVRLDASGAPHPAHLAARAFPTRLLDQRVELMRALGWWPATGDVVVVHGGAHADVEALATHARSVARDLGATPVVLETDAADHDVARRLAGALGCAALPPVAGVEDRVAAVAHSHAVVSGSPLLAALASAFGRELAREGEAPRLERETPWAELDARFDAIAAHVEGDDAGPLVPGEVAALRAALDARGRRLTFERLTFADHLDAVRGDAAQRLAERDETIGALRHENEVLGRMWAVRARRATGRALRRLGWRR